MNVESVRIVFRNNKADNPRAFSEIFIVADGEHYYSRTWDTIEDSPYQREHQKTAFLKRQAMYDRAKSNG